MKTTIKQYDDTLRSKHPPTCVKCGQRKNRTSCHVCDGAGVFGHDCGEEVCCCLDPEDNDPCEECRGRGWYWSCDQCEGWNE